MSTIMMRRVAARALTALASSALLACGGGGGDTAPPATSDQAVKPSEQATAAAGQLSLWAGHASTSGYADGAAADARFKNPSGMAIDASGNLYVADRDNRVIRKVAPDGTVSTLAGKAGAVLASTDGQGDQARFSGPSSMILGQDGHLYVIDDNTVRRVTLNGLVSTVTGKSGETYGGSLPSDPGPRFTILAGIAQDAQGHLYVSDSAVSVVYKITLTPTVTVSLLAGAPLQRGTVDASLTSARFNQPEGLATDAAGNVYVAEWADGTIRKITPQGMVSTYAGKAGVHSTVNGTLAQARFARPSHLRFDGSGNLIIVDVGNDTIRKIATDGTVSTLAGDPDASGVILGNLPGSLDNPQATVTLPNGQLAIAARHGIYVTSNAPL